MFHMLMRRIPLEERENPAVAEGYRELGESVPEDNNRRAAETLSDVVGVVKSAAEASPWIGSKLFVTAGAMVGTGGWVNATVVTAFAHYGVYAAVSAANVYYYMDCKRTKCANLKQQYVACRNMCWQQGAIGLSIVTSELIALGASMSGLEAEFYKHMTWVNSWYKDNTVGVVMDKATPIYETIKWYTATLHNIRKVGVAVTNPYGAKRANDDGLGVRHVKAKTREPSRRRRGLKALHFARRLRPLD